MRDISERTFVFAGSYSDSSDHGIQVYAMDEEHGRLTVADRISGLTDPTFLNVNAPRFQLYAIAEGRSETGAKTGQVVTLSIDPNDGTLTELSRSAPLDATICHLQRDATDRYMAVSSYDGGRIGLYAISDDGRVEQLLDVKRHEGVSVNPARPHKSNPHSASFSPDNAYIFVPDLGFDYIRAYTIDSTAQCLRHHGDTHAEPAAGPRHMTFHPRQNYAYVIHEFNSTITSFRYDAKAGNLHRIQSVSTLPCDWNRKNRCAEIAVSKDGKYLYGSNRGHDSIVVYSIDSDTGALEWVEHVSSEGRHPRHFSITPNGKFLLVANRDTNNLAVFHVDPLTGKLRFTGQSLEISKPVCVLAANFRVGQSDL